MERTKDHITEIRKRIDGLKDGDTAHSEIIEEMENGIRSAATSQEEYKELLDFRMNFHQYSMRNTLLIYMQNPFAQFVGSYKKMQELGYQVQKGESSIKIMVPTPVTTYDVSGNGKYLKWTELNKAQRKLAKAGDYDQKTTTYFKYGNVFDIGQTNCPSEDLPKLLQGLSHEEHKDITLEDVVETAKQIGLDVEITNLKSVTLGGYYQPSTDDIKVNDKHSETEQIHTLCHEIAHAILHKTGERPLAVEEVEAESTAYLAMRKMGYELPDYTFRYIKNYASKLEDGEVLQSYARIEQASDELAKAVGQTIANRKGIVDQEIPEASIAERLATRTRGRGR